MEYNVGFLFAAFCVAVYAHQRFNSPVPLRCTTTFVQYYLALGGYMIAGLGLYALLAYALEVNPQVQQLIGMMGGATVEIPKGYANLPAPFMAALFLTALLPKTPVLKTLDVNIQEFFRRLGAIPHKALTLSWTLQCKGFAIPAAQEGEFAHRLENLELDPKVFLEAPPQSTEASWTKIVSLKISMEDYEGAHPGFRHHQQADLSRLEEGYRRQEEMATILYGSEAGRERLKKAFHNDCKALLRQMTEAIARGMLQTHSGLKAVYAELTGWGFQDLESDLQKLTANQIAGLILALAIYMLVFFMILGAGFRTVGENIKWAITIAIIIGSAVGCAVLPKSALHGLAKRDREGRRPIVFYMLASLFAAAFWFIIHFVRYSLEGEHGLAAIPNQVLGNAPWVLMPVVIAFATAWMADNVPGRLVPKAAQDWLEGIVMAVLLAGTMFVVQHWLLEIGHPRANTERVPFLLAGAAGIGFIIGFFVPTLYRRLPKEERAARGEPNGTRLATLLDPRLVATD